MAQNVYMEEFHDHVNNNKNVSQSKQGEIRCFFQMLETQLEVWENEKCCGNTSVSIVHVWLSRDTYCTICFLFRLEDTVMKTEAKLCTLISKMSIIFACTIIMSTACATCIYVFLLSHNTILFHQSVHILRAVIKYTLLQKLSPRQFHHHPQEVLMIERWLRWYTNFYCWAEF